MRKPSILLASLLLFGATACDPSRITTSTSSESDLAGLRSDDAPSDGPGYIGSGNVASDGGPGTIGSGNISSDGTGETGTTDGPGYLGTGYVSSDSVSVEDEGRGPGFLGSGH